MYYVVSYVLSTESKIFFEKKMIRTINYKLRAAAAEILKNIKIKTKRKKNVQTLRIYQFRAKIENEKEKLTGNKSTETTQTHTLHENY